MEKKMYITPLTEAAKVSTNGVFLMVSPTPVPPHPAPAVYNPNEPING